MCFVLFTLHSYYTSACYFCQEFFYFFNPETYYFQHPKLFCSLDIFIVSQYFKFVKGKTYFFEFFGSLVLPLLESVSVYPYPLDNYNITTFLGFLQVVILHKSLIKNLAILTIDKNRVALHERDPPSPFLLRLEGSNFS